jgi:ribose 5-phosphate isomerase RpiB
LDCNIIGFGERIVGSEVAKEALEVFLTTEYEKTIESEEIINRLNEIIDLK